MMRICDNGIKSWRELLRNMPRKKLQRIRALTTLPHSVSSPEHYRDVWSSDYFHRVEGPLVLELACGKGEYALALAAAYPDRNYLGIDRKGERLWCAATCAEQSRLTNVAFVNADIAQLEHFFAPQEIAEIWITFPDPFPKEKQARKRLTSPDFLAQYQRLLQHGGTLHLLTDDRALFEYSLESATQEGWNVRDAIEDVDAVAHSIPLTATTFEQRHRANGKKIHYLRIQSFCRAGEN